ncbi:MAG: hypothetical protein MR698_10115 [Selenomonas sp.]|nr:hypothetical protein [Selenomonas sp.]
MMTETFENFCADAAKRYEDFLDLFFWQILHAHPEQTRALLCQIGSIPDEAERLVVKAKQNGENSFATHQLFQTLASVDASHHKHVEDYVYRMMYDESPDFYDAYARITTEEETSA